MLVVQIETTGTQQLTIWIEFHRRYVSDLSGAQKAHSDTQAG